MGAMKPIDQLTQDEWMQEMASLAGGGTQSFQPSMSASISIPDEPIRTDITQSTGRGSSEKLVDPTGTLQAGALQSEIDVNKAQAMLPVQQQQKLLKEKVSDSATEKISDYDGSIIATDNAIEMWNQNGGFNTGPGSISNYSGTIGDWARQAGGNKDFSAFFAETEKMFQLFRKITTGAQASDRELRMLRPLIAKSTDIPKIFIAKALASREIARALRANYIKRQGEAGRDITGFRDITSPEDVEYAKQLYENALLSTGMDDAEAQKLVEDTFGRTAKLVGGRKTLKGTPLDLSGGDDGANVGGMSDEELMKLAGL